MEAPLYFELRKPERIEPNRRYPALFLMHGMGSNEQDLLGLVEGLEDVYIFSIRGPLQQGLGYAFFTIEEYGKPHRAVFNEAVDKVKGLIDFAKNNYPIDPQALYLMGFSQGAILSLSLGLILGNQIKGIVALSGYIPDFIRGEEPQSSVKDLQLFISHGEVDQVLPFEWGKKAAQVYQTLGANVTFKNYPAGHGVNTENYHDLRNWLEAQLSGAEN